MTVPAVVIMRHLYSNCLTIWRMSGEEMRHVIVPYRDAATCEACKRKAAAQ